MFVFIGVRLSFHLYHFFVSRKLVFVLSFMGCLLIIGNDPMVLESPLRVCSRGSSFSRNRCRVWFHGLPSHGSQCVSSVLEKRFRSSWLCFHRLSSHLCRFSKILLVFGFVGSLPMVRDEPLVRESRLFFVMGVSPVRIFSLCLGEFFSCLISWVIFP